MKIVRLYTGSDQQSHFEDMELSFAGAGNVIAAVSQPASDVSPGTAVAFRSAPPGTVIDWHPAPRRQYVVTLSGQWDIECGDGSVRRFKPGDVMLAEDLNGKGHVTRVVGDAPHILMTIPVAGP